MRNPWRRAGAETESGSGDPRHGNMSDHFEPSALDPALDFGSDDRADPADLMAIRADDELLDALASGHPLGDYFRPAHGQSVGQRSDHESHADPDDQAVFEMLRAWRADCDTESIPELITIEEAAAAIAAGRRARPVRRLMPVTAAAALVVLALSGVGIAAGNAKPGSPLWGLTSVLNPQRAASLEAVHNVQIALTSAKQALAEGNPTLAQQAITKAGPELDRIQDQSRKQQLDAQRFNLAQTAHATHQGESVQTNDDGVPKDFSAQPYRELRWLQPRRSHHRHDSKATSGSPSASYPTYPDNQPDPTVLHELNLPPESANSPSTPGRHGGSPTPPNQANGSGEQGSSHKPHGGQPSNTGGSAKGSEPTGANQRNTPNEPHKATGPNKPTRPTHGAGHGHQDGDSPNNGTSGDAPHRHDHSGERSDHRDHSESGDHQHSEGHSHSHDHGHSGGDHHR